MQRLWSQLQRIILGYIMMLCGRVQRDEMRGGQLIQDDGMCYGRIANL